jgi:hypothetical protein
MRGHKRASTNAACLAALRRVDAALGLVAEQEQLRSHPFLLLDFNLLRARVVGDPGRQTNQRRPRDGGTTRRPLGRAQRCRCRSGQGAGSGPCEERSSCPHALRAGTGRAPLLPTSTASRGQVARPHGDCEHARCRSMRQRRGRRSGSARRGETPRSHGLREAPPGQQRARHARGSRVRTWRGSLFAWGSKGKTSLRKVRDVSQPLE